MGGYNNVIKVNCNDLEVFKALEMDTVTLESLAQEYGTRIPDLESNSGPPLLPPQLIHVILNKETPLNCEAHITTNSTSCDGKSYVTPYPLRTK